MSNKRKGVIKFWNPDKGFGFLETGEYPYDYDVFLHISSYCEDYEPCKGDVVEFQEKHDKKRGKPFADNIIPTGEKSSQFENRVSRRRLEEARNNSKKYDRGYTCEQDLKNCEDRFDLYGGRCWYCNEMDK
jgi:cold shock CspA family protein